MTDWQILQGDAITRLRELPANSVHCCVTSPPYYGLRDYGTAQWEGGSAECDHTPDVRPRAERANPGGSNIGKGGAHNDAQDKGVSAYRNTCGKCGARRIDGQIGLESSPTEFVAKMVEVFAEVWRVLRSDGTLWLNLGDSYCGYKGDNYGVNPQTSNLQTKSKILTAHNIGTPRTSGLKPKDLMLMPARVALALQEAGWWVRSDIIWCKRAPMPESVTDRPTSAHEHVFLLSKSANYYYDGDAIRERQVYADPSSKANTNGHSARTKDGLAREELVMTERYNNPLGRNAWNWWPLSPEPYAAAHFATFPTEIPRRAILAGTSEHGVCGECGSPWRRVVERVANYGARQDRAQPIGVMPQVDSSEWRPSTVTDKGWQPTCKHNAPIVPATVLDCFSGAGTTVMQALRLGRRGIGIELNPQYVALSEARIVADAPLFNMPQEAIA